jgi:TAG lipase/steryl ester hydrolase/phospholipase A2/LPA acyltransferase
MLNSYAVITIIYLLKSHAYKIINIYKLLDKRNRILLKIRKDVNNATTSEQWKLLAMEYERKNKEYFGSSRGMDIRSIYDKDLVKSKLEQLQKNKLNKNIHDFMNILRLDLTRNIGNIAKNRLHEHFLFMPNTILKYVSEVKEQLDVISANTELKQDEKIQFFRETRHSYGRTSLLLSGGASFGTFHMGVVKALFENRLLPRIIAGSSVGSIVASIISVRTDKELTETFKHLDEFDLKFFSEHKTINFIRNFLQRGHVHDDKYLINKLRVIIGDYTFQEAYERTGRILNISVCPVDTNESARVLNYLTAPSVLIWSAVAASSAFPGLFPSQKIYTKNEVGKLLSISKNDIIDSFGRKWQDGSIDLDLPVETLKEMFNCNYFIVSQCNPIVMPLLNMKRTVSPTVGNILEMEFKHRCEQLKMLLPRWIPSRWLNLFTQNWEGDVTIVSPVTFVNPGKMLTNPSVKDIINYVKIGEKKTWENIWAIESNCSIETYLDNKVKTLCGGSASWGYMSTSDLCNIQTLQRESSSMCLSDEIAPIDCCTCQLNVLPSLIEISTNSSLDYIAT